MLVCNVSLRPPRRAIVAAIVEAATATDATATGNVIFAALVDDPASVGDLVDAYLGEIMLEAATANDDVNAGFAYAAAIVEVGTGAETQDATTTSAPTFTTWNPADLSGVTLSGGNLIATTTAGVAGVRGIASHATGKYYLEYKYTTINTNGFDVGIATSTFNLTGATSANAAYVVRSSGAIQINGSGVGTPLGIILTNNVIGVAVDLNARLIWFRIAPSGNWNGSGTADPATGAGGLSISALSGALYPLFIGGSGDVCTANFGASAFTGAVPSGFNSGF